MLVELSLAAIVLRKDDRLSTHSDLLRYLSKLELYPNARCRFRADRDGFFHRLKAGNDHMQRIISWGHVGKLKCAFIVGRCGKRLFSGRGSQINIDIWHSGTVRILNASVNHSYVFRTLDWRGFGGRRGSLAISRGFRRWRLPNSGWSGNFRRIWHGRWRRWGLHGTRGRRGGRILR